LFIDRHGSNYASMHVVKYELKVNFEILLKRLTREPDEVYDLKNLASKQLNETRTVSLRLGD
jgi:hypothetical protein